MSFHVKRVYAVPASDWKRHVMDALASVESPQYGDLLLVPSYPILQLAEREAFRQNIRVQVAIYDDFVNRFRYDFGAPNCTPKEGVWVDV